MEKRKYCVYREMRIQMDSLMEKRKRIYLLDIIRGILIIYVVYYMLLLWLLYLP